MGKIVREPAAAARERYDLIIIGGGIHGAMLSLEASRLGLRSLLLERADFGGATTFNSLRILHGGLRYLQTADLRRFRESVGERRWFLQTFPELVEPLACLMPLYGNGLLRPSIFNFAIWTNDLLSRRRNQGVRSDLHLPGGRVVNPAITREIFPAVDPRKLRGGAIWYDACMPNSERLLIEILRWAVDQGATALNYVEARELLRTGKGVAGITGIDRQSGETFEYRADIVVNAAGPWCRHLAHRFDRDQPNLFRGSLAWNILLKRKALSDHAVAVSPKKAGGRIYFLLPWKGMLLAGTGHAPWSAPPEEPAPSEKEIQDFLDDLNQSIPGLEVVQSDILRVFAGLLPVTREGSVNLARLPVILHHGDQGGPEGLYSISGVKFTTSRLVAKKALNRIFQGENGHKNKTPLQNHARRHTIRRGIFASAWWPSPPDDAWKRDLRCLIVEEAVQHLDDLFLRRTNLWENASRALLIAPHLCELFEWDAARCRVELERLTDRLCRPQIGQSGQFPVQEPILSAPKLSDSDPPPPNPLLSKA